MTCHCIKILPKSQEMNCSQFYGCYGSRFKFHFRLVFNRMGLISSKVEPNHFIFTEEWNTFGILLNTDLLLTIVLYFLAKMRYSSHHFTANVGSTLYPRERHFTAQPIFLLSMPVVKTERSAELQLEVSLNTSWYYVQLKIFSWLWVKRIV